VRDLLDGDLERFGAEAVVLSGLLIEDPKQNDRLRLYLTSQMDVCVEFLAADMLHAEPIAKGPVSPIGGTIVWLKEEAVVQFRRAIPAPTAQGLAAFLQGGLAGRFMPGTALGSQVLPTWGGTAASLAGCGGNRGGGGGSWAGCGSESAAGCGTGPVPPTVFPYPGC